ncbi:hypothetical protein ACOZ38_33715 [Sphaerisporangium viridialbum]|uniref:hypothetical protein n=1 Tax=Sphaerisporangium viridialbum TaxID=46189 RepID=UPI003C7559AE
MLFIGPEAERRFGSARSSWVLIHPRISRGGPPSAWPSCARRHRVGASGGTVITRSSAGDVRWWTWAGFRANATLAATLAGVADEGQRVDDAFVRLREELTAEMWKAATADATEGLCLPDIDEKALNGLKFSTALPERLATATLAARLADLQGEAAVLAEPARFSLVG